MDSPAVDLQTSQPTKDIRPKKTHSKQPLPAPESIEEIELTDLSEVGSGGGGTVYRAQWKGQLVAVKKYNDELPSIYARKEKKILSVLNHPNVVKLIGFVTGDDYAPSVLEFVERGTLFEYLQESTDKNKSYLILSDVLKGLIYLHSLRLIYMDIKSQNILLNHNLQAKICDFDLSIALKYGQTEYIKRHQIGTDFWSGPEMHTEQNKVYTQAYDIYPVGWLMSLFEMGCKKSMPYEGYMASEAAGFHKEGKAPPIPKETSATTRTLILNCTKKNPRQRPTAQQVYDEVEKICAKPM